MPIDILKDISSFSQCSSDIIEKVSSRSDKWSNKKAMSKNWEKYSKEYG